MRRIITVIAAAGLAGLAAACDVEQTEEGSLPEVDVNATGGEMPAYDVDTKDVDITTEEKTVEVPVVTTEPDTEE